MDHVDEAEHAAWSVLVRRAAHEVELDHAPELLRSMQVQPPTPWALGVHNSWLRILASGMTGRRLGAPGAPRVF